jgi:hypothetical protein
MRCAPGGNATRRRHRHVGGIARLSQSASFYSNEQIAPSNLGIKHLAALWG